MKSNYNLPKTKAATSSLIRALATGNKTIDELKEDQEIKVSMYLAGDGSFPDGWGKDANTKYVTLNLSA